MTDRPTLYAAPYTRSATTLWLNEELGDVCDIHWLDLRGGAGRAPAFLQINPMGKVPTLVHRGVVVTEAAAICAYLADTFPERKLAPAPGDPARGAYFRWMFFAPSCIEPMMLDKLGGVTQSNAAAAGHGDYDRVLGAIASALSVGPYLLGEAFSAADIVFGSTLNFATRFGAIPKDDLLGPYIDRLVSRPAFVRSAQREAAASA